jgi:thiamine-phosphate pyrophosphorylase
MQLREKIKLLLKTGSLYGITDPVYSQGKNIITAQKLIQGGVKIIQYRAKNLDKGLMYQELIEIRKITQKAGVLLIVNDHPDLCLLTRADGVHLGQGDLPVKEVRKLLGEDKIIGHSTHNKKQGLASTKLPLDYLGVGPMFPTKTKPHEPVSGLPYAKFATAQLHLPLVAIGGITEENLPLVLKQGIKSVAMVGDILLSTDIAAKSRKILTLL